MAKIDNILSGMNKFGAESAVVRSGVPIMLRFASGDRFANQKMHHQDVVSLVREVAPPEVEADLLINQRGRFKYNFDTFTYGVSVEPSNGQWTVIIAPFGAQEKGAHSPEKDKKTAANNAAPLQVPPPSQQSATSGNAQGPPEKVSSGARCVDFSTTAESTSPVSASSPSKKVSPRDSSGRMIDVLLRAMCERGSSDLHLVTGNVPFLRIDGAMVQLDGHETLEAETLYNEIKKVMPASNESEFQERNDTDFAYEIEGVARFRVNVFRDRLGPGTVIRRIPFEILTPEQLGLPKEVLKLCFLTKGLVLVTGPTGSGKSTTLAALIDYINSHRDDHIITIEDPIEFVHQNKKCLVNQREVFTHTRSFKDALRAALREDPDIVLVGEMRDLETISIAVETAETGHLVFGTLHTTTAPSTIDRIIDQFPADRQEQIRQMVSESLRGVIAQNLCKKKGGGRVAAFEILIGSPAVSNLIRERKTFQLFSVMQTGRAQGMITLNDSLLSLVKQDLIMPLEAYMKAADKEAIKRHLVGLGHELPTDAS